MLEHLDILISGRVQGVAFRWSAKKKADQFCITGFITNKTDGSVYIEAEGSTENLEKFACWYRRGPILAKIERLEIKKADLKNFTNFEIK